MNYLKYLILSIILLKMFSSSGSKMVDEKKQLGEDRVDSYKRYNKCDKRSNNERYSSSRNKKGGSRSRNRSRTREGRERINHSGMPVVNIKLFDNGVFLNEEFLRNCSDSLGQIIIVDSGCPRSLMGDQEVDKLKGLVELKVFKVKDEGFRFGPSRIYNSSLKAKFTMQIGSNKLTVSFS